MTSLVKNKAFLDTIQKMIEHRLTIGGMDNYLKKVKVTSAEEGVLKATMTVEKEHANVGGTLHGAMATFLVDVMSGLSLGTCPNVKNTGVSLNLNMTFVKPAALGEEIEIISKVDKAGGKMAFLSVEILNKNGDLIAKGSHTKYIAVGRPESEIQR